MSSSSKYLRRDGSGAGEGPGKRNVSRMTAEENNAIKQLASGFARSNTSAAVHNATIGDAIMGEDALSLLTKLSRLEKDLERRNASYAAREEAYKERVAALEEELASQHKGHGHVKKTDSKLSELKSIQAEILESVELVQDRTARIMQEQERDLLRSFRARLFDVQTDLEKEKSKKDDGLAAWRERFTQLEAELDWATEVSNRLDKVNATLTEENHELKIKYNSQEQDRNLFIELLVSLKKDNALWRSKNAEIIAENDRLKVELEDQIDVIAGQASLPPMGGGSKGFQAAALAAHQSVQVQRLESEEKFKDVNVRLRRLVAEERKSLQQLRQTYATELKTRTEMEMLLRKCVDDVRQDIAEMHHEAAQFSNNTAGNDLTRLYNAQPGAVPFDDFDSEERKSNLELLLSQERVVALIYAKTFPIVSKPVSSAVRASVPKPAVRAHTGELAGSDPAAPDADDVAAAAAIANRPLTANAILASMGVNRTDKFPPIGGATTNFNRMASR